jgi:PAS domain S-box-containing protein
MTNRLNELEAMYEVSLSIGTSIDLSAMLRTVCTTMLRTMNGSGVQVLQAVRERGGDPKEPVRISWQPVVTLPATLKNSDTVRTFLESMVLCGDAAGWDEWQAALPCCERLADGTMQLLFALDDFGVLYFESRTFEFDRDAQLSIQVLMHKVGRAAKDCLREAALLKLTRAVEQSPAIVMITDLSGAIEYVNPVFAKITGYTAEEVMGRNPSLLKSGYTPETEYKKLWTTLAVGRDWQGTFRNRRKDGTYFWESAAISALRDAQGRSTHYVAVKEDITDRKAAEDRLHAFAECLLSFGSDAQANINRIVELCGVSLGGVCALYSRVQNDLLHSVGQWHTPPDFEAMDAPEGHLCYDVVQRNADQPQIMRGLQKSQYFTSDPNVAKYQLETYIGMAVRRGEQAVGSLSVVFQNDVEPNAEQLKGSISMKPKLCGATQAGLSLSRDFIMRNGMALLPVLAAGCGAQYIRIGKTISESFR